MATFRRWVDRLRGQRSGAQASTGPALTKRDMTAAVTAAVANIPDGMASGALAGVNPVYGLYTLMVATPTTALLTSTQILVFNTTSAMTLVAADGLGDRTGDDRVHALFAIALVCGAFQLALGLLGLGMLTRFVSNAVMTGFLTGIGVLIILGQLWDLTGYEGEGGSKLEQTAQLLGHLDEIDVATTFVGLLALVLMVALRYTRLATFNLLVALAVAMIVTQYLEWLEVDSVALVSSLGDIPRSLPLPTLSAFGSIPEVLLAGIATAVVGLLQAAGVAQRFPNADGSEPDDSRDFLAQGAGNIAGGLFQGMPGGGSLSGTSLLAAAGGRSRWAIVVQAPLVLILVLVFSDLLSIIPMAALAALLVYSAALSIKFPVIATVANATPASYATMIVTFVATLVIPLQQAVVLGVVLAAVLFIYRSSNDVRVVQIQQRNGDLIECEPAPDLVGDRVTVLDVYGSLFYAGAKTLGQRLPAVRSAERAVVVLRLRGQGDVGSTFLNMIGKYASELRAHDGELLLSGVDPNVKSRLAKTGHLDQVGETNVFIAGDVIGRSTRAAFASGQAWLERARTAVTAHVADQRTATATIPEDIGR